MTIKQEIDVFMRLREERDMKFLDQIEKLRSKIKDKEAKLRSKIKEIDDEKRQLTIQIVGILAMIQMLIRER